NSSKEDFRLRVFLTLAQEGSFTKTASVLGKTQPAISASLSELEKIYGLKLIERDKSGNSLTASGRLFREYAERIEGAYRDLAYMCERLSEESGQAGTVSDYAISAHRQSANGTASGESLAAETLRCLLPALRKMDLALAEQIERLLNTQTDKK
ncbi:MAG: LysR family transcriptional regulator, partial [Candidatus Cryptobacteroides sp.]